MTTLKENEKYCEIIVQDVRRERSLLLVIYRYNSTQVHVQSFIAKPIIAQAYKELQ